MPPDHARTVAAARRFSTREKRILAAVSGLSAALVVVVAIAIAAHGHSSSNGCVDFAIPYDTGATEIHHCGAAARGLCASVDTASGFSGAVGRSVATECRKAGLPVGGGAQSTRTS